jgi:proline iminopeptidase
MENLRLIGSRGYPIEDADLQGKIEKQIARCYYPEGFGRQLLAIMATGSLVGLTRSIAVPTHVIHGAVDPLVPVEAGIDLAKKILGATLKIFEGMGHDLPPALIPLLVQEVVQHLQRAESQMADKSGVQAKGSCSFT